MSAAQNEIKRATAAITQKNDEMNAVRGVDSDDLTKSKAFLDNAARARNSITERHITQINEILEVASPDGLVLDLKSWSAS